LVIVIPNFRKGASTFALVSAATMMPVIAVRGADEDVRLALERGLPVYRDLGEIPVMATAGA